MCLLRFVLFLSAIAATGYGLQCIVCYGMGSESCLVPTVASCPAGNVCASRYKIAVLGLSGFIFQNFHRFCAYPSECNATGTLRRHSTVERIATTCCSTDRCTPEKPIAPDESPEPNGLQCDKCFNDPSCFYSDSTNCMGDETMCHLETTKKTTGSVTVTTTEFGCASEGLCNLRNTDSTSGYGLQCIDCSGIGSDSCIISTVASCPDGNVCASRYKISIIEGLGFISQSFNKFCAHPSECNVTGIYRTSDSTSERTATTCCSTDQCTPEKPIAPDESSAPNGLQCDQCFRDPSCLFPGSTNCMGDETMCLLKTTKQTTGSMTVSKTRNGCASKGLCYLGNTDSTSGTVHEEITYSCTPASGAPYNTSPTALIVLSPLLSFITVVFQYNIGNL